MAQSNLLSGLVAKRAEVAGQIQALQRDVAALAADVRTLDGAIRIIDPTYNVRGIRAKRSNRKNQFFTERGEASKFVLDSLRAHRDPISTNELAEIARVQKGLDAPDLKALRASILTTLSRQRIKGVVIEVGRDETGTIKWQLAV
jgi:hypothetical protein